MQKTKTVITLLLAAVAAFGQTVPAATPASLISLPATLQQVTLPTYVGGGLTYDQAGGVKGFVFGATPVSNSVGIYAGTAADLLPFHYVDAATGKTVYSVQTQFSAVIFKSVYSSPKWQILVGLKGGGAFTAAATNLNVSIAAGGIVAVAYHLNAHFSLLAPISGTWNAAAGPAGGWNLSPGFGGVWTP